MAAPAGEPGWQDAIGVLPLETVLAEEHDRIHGDDSATRVERVDVRFTPEQISDPTGFAQRVLRGDGVASYLLDALDVERRPAVLEALARCAAARGEADPRLHASEGCGPDAVAGASSPVAAADAELVRQIVPHLNALLDAPLDRSPAFKPFLAAGAVSALGRAAPHTPRLANRLLLEAALDGQIRRLQDMRLDVVFDAVRRRDTSALCLSGGGIRSATFANGVLRGLARHGMLGKFDYLSTVSGGGYAGSWLTAWMHHAGAPEVHQQLATPTQEKLAPEPPAVQHLRAFSHYLTPRVGLFSTDTWTLIATVGRNLLFTWAVLLPLMAAALLVPRFALALVRVDYSPGSPMEAYGKPILGLLFYSGIVLLTYGVRSLHRNRPEDEVAPGTTRRRAAAGSQRDLLLRSFLPLAAGAVLLSLEVYLWVKGAMLDPAYYDDFTQGTSVVASLRANGRLGAFLTVMGGLVHLTGWALSGRPRRHVRESILVLLSGLAAGFAAFVLLMALMSMPASLARDALFTTLAPPAMLGVLVLGSQLFTALTSRGTNDDEREWIARFNAWLLIAMVLWAGACALVLFGPSWVAAGWRLATLAAVGGGSGIVGVLLARSGSKQSPTAPPGLLAMARKGGMALVAPVFAVAIVIGLAAANEGMIAASCSVPGLAGVLDCRSPGLASDDISHSQPFLVRAGHMTENLIGESEGLASTGADAALAQAFVAADARARELGASGERTAARWDSLLEETRRLVVARVDAAYQADAVLGARMDAFMRTALAADSAILGTVDGDPAQRDSLLARRARAVERADQLLHRRRIGRDSAATEMDRRLTSIAALQAGAEPSPGGARTATLAALRGIVDERLGTSIALFRTIKSDSATLARSAEAVALEIEEAGAVPYDGAVPATILSLFAALLGMGLLFGWRIDTNRFSLRAMYQMRLVRAYLGASRTPAERRPNPFTGFDPRDDIPMAELWPNWGPTPAGAGRSPSSPPLHVVNTTLNLVAGANLAWQQRKAESMTISPLHAGSAHVGYRATSPSAAGGAEARLYGGEGGITLGTAVTISGAAASPNSGALSSPTATFLMTFFNARLGAWLGNPGRAGARTFHLGAPTQSVQPILAEMFGMTTDRSPYVALSDGGHFENLALYEMVLRRCRFILVSDAGCDPAARFDDLGNAVRKIRVDMGVPIEFDDGVDIRSRLDPPPSGKGSYWAIGRIRYSAVDGTADPAATDGILVYLKPALYLREREPSDVKQYGRTSDHFPHESTADQFFSESQFESYRALGEFIVGELVAGRPSLGDLHANRTDSLLAAWCEPRGVAAPIGT